MCTVLLCSINARYTHTNLALRYLKTYGAQDGHTILIKEFTINQPLHDILRSIYQAAPDKLFFSVYLWNVELTLKVIREIKKILPGIILGIGGPEATYQAHDLMEHNPEIDYCIKGEGEETFRALLSVPPEEIAGIVFRSGTSVYENAPRPPIADLDSIPFPYDEEDIENIKERIVYYESSRGCPFSCAYCLSSLDTNVRYFSMERVLQDLDYFLVHKVALVKFVDRTFNLVPERYLHIWKYLAAHDSGVTRFHFEIAADLLSDEALDFLHSVPENLFQFEIGIQSCNEGTLNLVNRRTNLVKIKNSIAKIPETIHVHLDLIAGLPAENLASFGNSFDYTMQMKPDMFQLGFLKILGGTKMEAIAHQEGFAHLCTPPYEVLSTPYLSFADILFLKDLETTIDIYYNSGHFNCSITYLLKKNAPFAFFSDLTNYLANRNFFETPHKLIDYFTSIHDYLCAANNLLCAKELLRFDYIANAKTGVFPQWYTRSYDKNAHEAALEQYKIADSKRQSYINSDYERFEINPVTYEKTTTEILFIYSSGFKATHMRKDRRKFIIL